jgi:hypothetical protein
MPPKIRTTPGPAVGAIAANWKIKLLKVNLDELLVIMEKASSKQIKRTKTFKIAIHNIKAGHSDWALHELNSARGLLEDTIGHYSDMLNTIKF